MMQQGKKLKNGFSLVELVVVVGMIMVLASFAIIQTRTTTANTRANAAMDALIGQLRQGRQLAISLRRNVLVTLTSPNEIQLAVETLPGEPPAATIAPVYLNDNANGAAQFYVFPQLPDTPMGFGNSTAINFTPASGGATGLSVMFSTSGSLVGTTAANGFSQVGNNNPVNASIFIGVPGNTVTARAVTILGATGRVRSYYWTGPSTGGSVTNWNE